MQCDGLAGFDRHVGTGFPNDLVCETVAQDRCAIGGAATWHVGGIVHLVVDVTGADDADADLAADPRACVECQLGTGGK